MGALTYTLVDLDPLDGITPSLQFKPMPYVPAPGQEIEGPRVSTMYSDGDAFQHVERFGTGTGVLGQGFARDDNLSITGVLSGRGDALSHQIEINAFAQTDGSTVRSGTSSVYTGRLEFDLSPNTAVVFDLTVDVEGNLVHGPELHEFYQSAVTLYLAIGNSPFPGFDSQYRQYTANTLPEFGGQRSLDITEMLSVSYQNLGPNTVSGFTSFDAWGQAYAGPLPPPIPEPRMLPMLAAGLFIVGWWSRRRRPS
ncbi:PEP-CTERM sorting domain-containing protein [Pseudoduganella sp. GCM10020061]|uniref:PEP-CTERM sorting domain-containing protein n=1 Tax=Pseudoduganella sp. GCM10020061 TaxID=3317345 RepID=UPI0036416783